MKTPEELEDWVAERAQSFEEAFLAGKFGRAAMDAEQIYTVLRFISMEQEAEQIMDKLGWDRIEKAFAEARTNVGRGPDYKKAV